MGNSRLIGRDTELAQLSGFLSDARDSRRGRGRVVVLTGRPGVGKTSLAHAFLERVGPASSGAPCLAVRCVQGDSGLRPFGLFRDLIAELCRWSGTSGLEETLRREAPAWLPQARRSAGRRALFDQFVSLWRTLAQQSAPVVLLDDVQWSDQSSHELLIYLGQATADVPMLVLATYEEGASGDLIEERGVRQRFGAAALEFAVPPLAPGSIREQAEGILGRALRDEFGDWLSSAAAGLPFRAEQVLLWLKESGRIRRRFRRCFVPARKLPPASLAIEEVLAWRLERVTAESRWMLEAASLAGPLIDSAVVASQLGSAEQDVIAGLNALAGREGWVEPLADRVGPSGHRSARYRFRHSQVRQLLRDRVTEKRRAALRGRAGLAILELAGDGSDQLADVLANLFASSDQRDRVYEWTLKAADLAERLHAFPELEALLSTGARLVGGELERLQIEGRLAKTLALSGKAAEAETLSGSVLERARRLGEDTAAASEGTQLAWIRLEQGDDLAEIAGLSGRLVDGARRSGLPGDLVAALDLSCVVAERLGRAEQVTLAAEEALYVAEQSGEDDLLARAAQRLAGVHVRWGSPENGRKLAQRALEAFRRLSDLDNATSCWELLGDASYRAGGWEEAVDQWEGVIDAVTDSGLPQRSVELRAKIAEVLALRGEFDEALRNFEEALQGAEGFGDTRLVGRCRTGLARLEYERADYAAVLELTERIRDELPASGAWKEDFRTTALRALAFLELGDELQAWQEAARLERLYQGMEGWFAERAEGDAVRIRVIDLDSDAWLAELVALQTIEETEGKDPYGEGFLQYHRAVVLARFKPVEALQAARRALELFEGLGAAPMQARVRALSEAVAARRPAADLADWPGEPDPDSSLGGPER